MQEVLCKQQLSRTNLRLNKEPLPPSPLLGTGPCQLGPQSAAHLCPSQCRKARCERELGQGAVRLHLHAAAGTHISALFWVGLLRASHLLEDVWWWSEGAAALMSSCLQARTPSRSRVRTQD